MSRNLIACLLAMAAAGAGQAGERAPTPAAPSGVRVLAQPSPPSLPLERDRVDRRRIVEQRLADGTVLAHLDGEGKERTGLVIGPGGARPVCGSLLEPAAAAALPDFRRRDRGASDGRR
jgi:hypothetical protein